MALRHEVWETECSATLFSRLADKVMHQPLAMPAVRGVTMLVRCMMRCSPRCLRSSHVRPGARRSVRARKNKCGPLRASEDDREVLRAKKDEPRVAETTPADHLHHTEAGNYLEVGPFGLAMGEEAEADEGVASVPKADPHDVEAAAAARPHDADQAVGYGEAMRMEKPSPALHDLYVDLYDSEEARARRFVDTSTTVVNPYSTVFDNMSQLHASSFVCPDTLLDKALPILRAYTGVPVVDQRGVCVGVLSDVDVYKFLGHFVPSEQVNQMKSTKVKEVMSMPALVVHAHAHVADAAGMLIKHKIHRLPVVEESDGELIVVGILSRADVFEPVIPDNTPDALLSRMAGGAARDEPHFADD